jgi:cytochrome P450
VIQELVDALLDAGLQDGRIDLMRHLASPLPLLITSSLLGVEGDDKRRMRAWANAEIVSLGPDRPEALTAHLIQRSDEMYAYFRERVERARRDGSLSGSLFARLLGAADEGQLSDDELIAFLSLLVRAGSHTVTHLIGNGMIALLANRPFLDMLRESPELWPAAITELARHSGPIQSLARVVRKEVTVHGRTLRRGERVDVVIASANRDERKFPEPDALRLDRDPREHVAFGTGLHYCVGAELGKLQARIALERLITRMPLVARMEVLREPDWQPIWAIRGLARLPLRGG